MYRDPDEAAAEVNKFLTNHPLSIALRADPAWSESRPHLRYPEEHRKHSLTAGTLMGPGRVPVPPLVFTDQKHLVSLSYLGTDLCGHVGIVHGGMLATMLDEGLARCSFASLPNQIGVTASLTVNYRKPAPAGSFVVLKAETTKVEGRKVWVKGRIELLGKDETPGMTIAEAEALFIEPKYAAVRACSFHNASRLVTNECSLYPSSSRSRLGRNDRVIPRSQLDPTSCMRTGRRWPTSPQNSATSGAFLLRLERARTETAQDKRICFN